MGEEIKIEKNYRERIDKFLVKKFTELTRSKIQQLLKDGIIKVNQKVVKPSYKLKAGDIISIGDIEPPPPLTLTSKIPLNIVYEDEYIIAVNKQPGVVSHPAGRYRENTLLQGVYYYLEEKKELPKLITPLFKPTLLHRLDKDTSGIILIAKRMDSYYFIQKQFIKRTIYKEYWCIVEGEVNFDSDQIEKKIGKSKLHLTKMAISEQGKESQTIYKVLKRFKNFSLLCAIPKTGRTHQIRIHLASIGHPILCDSVYGKRKMLYKWQIDKASILSQITPAKISRTKHEKAQQQNYDTYNWQKVLSEDEEPLIQRQALHAKKIQFIHPATQQPLILEAPIPQDIQKTLDYLSSQINSL